MELICFMTRHSKARGKRVSWGSVRHFPWRRGEKSETEGDFFFYSSLESACVCVKTQLMEGLHLGFQMCELSCCLSLRWSLSFSLSLSLSLSAQILFMQLLISSQSHHCGQTTAQIHWKTSQREATSIRPHRAADPEEGIFSCSIIIQTEIYF